MFDESLPSIMRNVRPQMPTTRHARVTGQSSPILAEDYLRGEADLRGEDEISSSQGILDISRPVKMSRFRGRGWATIPVSRTRMTLPSPRLVNLDICDVYLPAIAGNTSDS